MLWTRQERIALTGLGVTALCMMGLLWMVRLLPVRAVEGSTDSWTAQLSLAQRIPVNTAGVSHLRRLPGIGEALARRIVAVRKAEGSFRSLEDLERVPGIGPKKRQSLEAYVSLE